LRHAASGSAHAAAASLARRSISAGFFGARKARPVDVGRGRARLWIRAILATRKSQERPRRETQRGDGSGAGFGARTRPGGQPEDTKAPLSVLGCHRLSPLVSTASPQVRGAESALAAPRRPISARAAQGRLEKRPQRRQKEAISGQIRHLPGPICAGMRHIALQDAFNAMPLQTRHFAYGARFAPSVISIRPLVNAQISDALHHQCLGLSASLET
jgi:hypothetical protein